jgi:enoyl-CoA hydratase/carnithine racemase
VSDLIGFEIREAVAELRFNRPSKKNAITADMYAELAGGLEAAARDPYVRVVLLTAAGDAFTAGNDLADFLNQRPAAGEMPVTRFLRTISTFPKPILAAVNGVAVGVGTTMLLHCDFVIASTNASFQLPFVNLGLVPEAASSLLLPRAIGSHRAAEMLMLGDPIDASTAERFGLVYRIVESGRLEATTRELALRLAAKPPEALRLTKALLRGDPKETADRMATEGSHFAERLQSNEAREAFAAFLAKREPVFQSVV